MFAFTLRIGANGGTERQREEKTVKTFEMCSSRGQ